MKLWICGIICTLFILIGTMFTASATSITDPINDVWHWSQTNATWSWTGNIENKPNIDITTVSGTIDGVNLTLSMTVAGTIQSSQKIWYEVWYNTSNVSYNMFWSNNKGLGMVLKKGGGNQFVTNITVSGNTFSAVFKMLSNESTADLWGYAAEYTTVAANQTTREWWGDWAPNSKIPFSIPPGGNPGNNTGGNNTGKKTPGFELLPVVAAVAVVVVILRRRR